MGLDQYLNVSQSESNWNFEVNTRGDNDKYYKILDIMGLDKARLEDHPSIKIEYTAIYWRKANQIHGWFVNTLGEGVDECQEIYVSREALVQLQSECAKLLSAKAVLDDEAMKELAMEVLPPMGGFFFGGYEIDEWYWGDIQHTYDSLTELLDEIPIGSWNHHITYQASW
jgi:hypothetical protein